VRGFRPNKTRLILDLLNLWKERGVETRAAFLSERLRTTGACSVILERGNL
jgi:hypothetical protein